MFKKTLVLAVGFSISAVSQAHAQTAQPVNPPTGYAPYYVQESVTPPYTPPPSSYAATQYGSASSPFAPIGDRIVSDPLYLPLKGQIYGTTAYTFGQNNSDNYNSFGVKTSSATGDNNTIAQSLAYGISDEFSIHLSDSYEINSSDSTASSTGSTTTSNSNGLTDPTIGATWRALDQARHYPVDVDLTVNYTPDMFTDSTGSSGHDGTVAAGRQSAAFIAGVGHEMKAFSVLGTATATYYGDRTYYSSSTADQYSAGDGFNYALAVNTQTRFTDRFSLNFGLGYNFVNDEGASNNTTGLSWTSKGADYFTTNAALNYHFIPNRLVGSVTYAYLNYADGGNSYIDASRDNSIENHYENVFGARLAYVFN